MKSVIAGAGIVNLFHIPQPGAVTLSLTHLWPTHATQCTVHFILIPFSLRIRVQQWFWRWICRVTPVIMLKVQVSGQLLI